MNWFFKTFLKSSKRTFSEIQARQVAQLPFPKALADSATTSAEIAKHVDSMLALQKRLASEQLSQREEQLRREIEATDRHIDQLVYQLYGLTESEIAIVEKDASPRSTDEGPDQA